MFTMDDALLESGARVVSRGATAARKLAAEIVPMWNNDSAANTMEFTSALKAVMIEGFGPVTGLMDAVYSGKVDESKDGFLHAGRQLLLAERAIAVQWSSMARA